jgi:hypothetical protein
MHTAFILECVCHTKESLQLSYLPTYEDVVVCQSLNESLRVFAVTMLVLTSYVGYSLSYTS